MVTILVTGCGGAVGLGVVRALRMSSLKIRLIGVDANHYSACFYLRKKNRKLHKTYVVPKAVDPTYSSEILNICRKENVKIIFPCTDAELEELALSKDEFAEHGIKTIISPIETVRVCRDKWLTYKNLCGEIPMPRSAIPETDVQKALEFTGLPAVIKPRSGWGSSLIHRVEGATEAQIALKLIRKPIIQEYLQGEEYTIDGLTDRHGDVICIIPRRRVKIYSGLTFHGITMRDEKLIELGKEIAESIKIVGPFNFQAIRVDGKPKVFEINPRFAGTGILSVKAGVNTPVLAVKEALNMGLPDEIDFAEGVVVSRYFDEVFFHIDGLRSREN